MNPVTESVNPEKRGAAYSQTLGNGLRVLELLREHPHGLAVNEVASALRIHRTVVYRLLGTLRVHHLVAQLPDGRYILGYGLFELTGTLSSDLRAAAEPYLSALAEEVGATAFLTLAEGDEAVSACVVEPRTARMHVSYRLGTRHPLSVSAAGLAILAAREPDADERSEVTHAREVGYAVTANELQPGAWGLATTLPNSRGVVEASIGVVAMSELDTETIADAVLRTARAISERTGG